MEPVDIDDLLERLAVSGLFPRNTASAPAGHMHLATEELAALAAYDGGSLSEPERRNWNRALVCSECFNRVTRFRHLVRQPEQYGVPDISVPFDRIWNHLQERTLKLVLEWVGLSLMVYSAGAHTRGAIRTRGSARSVQASAVQKDFGPYSVTVSVEVQDPAARSWTACVRVTPSENLTAKLYSQGLCLDEQAFEGRQEIRFSGLSDASYVLEFAMPGQPAAGVIELAGRTPGFPSRS